MVGADRDMKWKGVRFQIRDGWHDAGKRMTALGPPVFVGQEWLPVELDDEDDPTFFKLAGLIRINFRRAL